MQQQQGSAKVYVLTLSVTVSNQRLYDHFVRSFFITGCMITFYDHFLPVLDHPFTRISIQLAKVHFSLTADFPGFLASCRQNRFSQLAFGESGLLRNAMILSATVWLIHQIYRFATSPDKLMLLTTTPPHECLVNVTRMGHLGGSMRPRETQCVVAGLIFVW